MVIRCLFIELFLESVLNEEVGKFLFEDYEEYFRCVKMYINIYVKFETGKAEDAASASAASGGGKKLDKKKDKKKSLCCF